MVFSPDSGSVYFAAPQKPDTVESDIYEVPTYGGVVTPVVQDRVFQGRPAVDFLQRP